MKKRVHHLAVFFLIMVFCLIPERQGKGAEFPEEEYYFPKYQVHALVKKDATVEITENITVYFNQEKHGIYRDIPTKSVIKRDEGNHTYYIGIQDISVEGAPYETTSEGDDLRLIIGEEDKTVMGEQDYVIRYTLDLGDDGTKAYDELYLNLLPTDRTVPIVDGSFELTFEKEADLSGIQVYSGAAGNIDSGSYTAIVEGTTVTGQNQEILKAGENLTVHLQMEDGYFEGARKINPVPGRVVLALSAALFLFILIRTLWNRRKTKPEIKTEYYPPDGMTSAEMGYILDGNVDNRDVISLIVWLADRGYLAIEETEKGIVLQKKEKTAEGLPEHVKIFYDLLFKKKETVKVWKLDEKFLKVIDKTRKAIGLEFKKEKSLFSAKTIVEHICCLCAAMGLSAAGFAYNNGYGKYSGAGGVFLCGFLVLTLSAILYFLLQWLNQRVGKKRLGFLISAVVMLVFVLFCHLAFYGDCAYGAVMDATFLLAMGSAFSLGLQRWDTPYRRDLMGRILGFREFIKNGELFQLNSLAKENPSYFFHTLPYAWALNLTDKWVKKFEEIPLEEPDWWVTYHSNYYALYGIHHMTNSIKTGFDSTMEKINTAAASQGSSGSGSIGGGMSGGGAGGGGVGSW